MTHKITKDITTLKSGKIVFIAKAGDEVNVIGDHVNVQIVENVKGERFTCNVLILDRIKI